jgi:hypothetical protein
LHDVSSISGDDESVSGSYLGGMGDLHVDGSGTHEADEFINPDDTWKGLVGGM